MVKTTLEQWQKLQKPIHELLYNCSECAFLNDEWVSFPIGIGWSFIHFPIDIENFHTGNHEQLVMCSLGDTTDQRRRGHLPVNRLNIIKNLSKNNIFNHYIHPSVYFKNLSNFKFVISPEGNGIDCHRHYEALIAGCIPIVEENEMIREKYKGCPVLYTRDYSEITETYLLEQYNKMLYTEYDFSRLLLGSYSKSVQEEIVKNGNYWSMRLSGKNWYSII